MRRLLWCALAAALMAVMNVASAATVDWPAYMYGPAHGSFAADATAITVANAPTIGPAWTFNPVPAMNPDGTDAYFAASPTVADGKVFIGASNGVEYALDESTGGIVWSRFLGFSTPTTCTLGKGITSTAAVAPDPVSGTPTVYVGGGDGYLYALDAATGDVYWRSLIVNVGTTQNEGYTWSSATLTSGHVLFGIASNCDTPLVRGGLRMFDQATGKRQDTYWSMPKGEVGGGVWTSAAADGSAVWVATGDPLGDEGTPPPPDLGDSNAIVQLRIRGTRLVRKELWAPPDDVGTANDFGSSPTLFDATIHGTPARMVGACQKDGRFYALRRFNVHAGAVWSFLVNERTSGTTGLGCLAGAIWRASPSTLIVSGRRTIIDGVDAMGSVRSLDPATGDVVWQTPLQDGVLGSPTMNGNGVIAVITYSHQTNHYAYLIDASDGSILWQMSTPSFGFAQPVFADNYVFFTPFFGGMTAYCPGCAPGP